MDAEFSCVTPWQFYSKYQATGNILCQKMSNKKAFSLQNKPTAVCMLSILSNYSCTTVHK